MNLPVDLSIRRIAALAGLHPNTVGPKLSGAVGQYMVINKIFTVINHQCENEFRRYDHVEIMRSGASSFEKDENFLSCSVLFNAQELIKQTSMQPRDLADRSRVRTPYVVNILAGVPTFTPYVERVFEVMADSHGTRMSPSHHIFN